MQYNRRNRDRRGGHVSTMITFNGIGGNTPVQKRLLKKRQRKHERQLGKMAIKLGMEHYDIDIDMHNEDDIYLQYFDGMYLTPEQIRIELDNMFEDHPCLDEPYDDDDYSGYDHEQDSWDSYMDPYEPIYDPWY